MGGAVNDSGDDEATVGRRAGAVSRWGVRLAVTVLSLCASSLLIRWTDRVWASEPKIGAAAAKGEKGELDKKSGPTERAGALAMSTLARWPQPRAVLVVTGRQTGYFEPCGCTGLENQKGGLMRRATLLEQLRGKQWPVVPLDLGNQVRRIGKQSEIKFQMTLESLKKMGYRAVGLGPDDLRLASGELVAAVVNDPELFVAGNLNLLDLVPKSRVIEVGDLKIGVTSVLGAEAQQQVHNDAVEFRDTVASLKEVVAEFRRQECGLLLLLSYTDTEETERLVREVPEFDLVVNAAGAGEPTMRPEKVAGTSTQVIQVGAKGMYAGVIGIFEGQFRYQRVPLDATFGDDPAMLEALASYQQQLETLGLDGLGLTASPHPRGGEFVGSEKCGECHTKAYAIWEKTPHQKATADLVHPPERAAVQRQFDPECLSCHVTGWNAQGYYPYLSGYQSLTQTAHLTGNGCENCHGPGSQHVAVESGDVDATDAERLKLRQQMQLPLSAAERVCLECHDLDNSPDFHKDGAFERYWAEVRHVGKD